MILDKKLIEKAKSELCIAHAQKIAEELEIKDFDNFNLKGCCPFHKEDTPSFIFNPKSNSFYCFGCGKNYDILNHYMEHDGLSYISAVEKLFKEANIEYVFAEKNTRTKRDYKYPPYITNPSRVLVINYMQKRGISLETLDYCDVQQSKEGNIVWNFYDDNDVLTTIKIRKIGIIKNSDPKEYFLPDFDNAPILYNMNKCYPGTILIITEGQIDCLSVIESGYKNCVSVPSGTQNLKWIEECYEWLQQFDKFIIWFDNDKAGIKSKKEVIARLGSWKCKNVELPLLVEGKSVKDANDVLREFDKKKVLDIINSASDIPIQNIKNLAEADDFDISQCDGLKTEIKEIDDIVYKFVLGNVIVVTGKRGSGKSSFVNQMFVCNALDQGYDVFMYSGELGSNILKSWIETTLAGNSAIKIIDKHVRKIEPIAKIEMRKWYNNRVFIYDNPVDNSSNSILNKAEEVVKRFGAKVLVLDNMLTMDLDETENNQWQKQKQLMVRLINMANSLGCLIVLVVHPRKTSSQFEERRLSVDDVGGSGSIGNLSQYVIGVHRYTAKEKEGEMDSRGNYKKGKDPIEFDAYCAIMKNRLTGVIDDVNLNFDTTSYRFYTNETERRKRYSWDTRVLDKNEEEKAFIKNENVPSFME